MQVSQLAGKPADPSILMNIPRLVTAYYTGRPDPSIPGQRVVFGTSGHRGCSLDNAFNEAHILAITQAIRRALTGEFGTPHYTRIDAPVTLDREARLENLSPDAVAASILADEPITAKVTNAPGNNTSIGGLKVLTTNGWFAAPPSGTESSYEIYAESFKDQAHLDTIVSEAQAIVTDAFGTDDIEPMEGRP